MLHCMKQISTSSGHTRVAFNFRFFYAFRQLTVQNVRSSLHCDLLPNLVYSYQLYKLRNDSYTFEKLYELFDNEDAEEYHFENISHEWIANYRNSLKAEQTGIVLLKTEQMGFADHSSYRVAVCIDYFIEIGAGAKSEHQLYAGAVTIDSAVVASDQFRPCFQTHHEDYFKDLLAIKFASNFLALLVSFSQPPVEKLSDFIEQTLKFRRISSSSAMVSDARYLI
jgi:hypothetical protein